MIDLVLTRELVRNETAHGQDGDVDKVSAQTGFGFLFESILVRTSMPYKPIDIARPFALQGVG